MKKLVCPICEKETYWKGNSSKPFCSERCKLIDLASWIGGEYAIPGEAVNPCSPDENRRAKAAGNH